MLFSLIKLSRACANLGGQCRLLRTQLMSLYLQGDPHHAQAACTQSLVTKGEDARTYSSETMGCSATPSHAPEVLHPVPLLGRCTFLADGPQSSRQRCPPANCRLVARLGCAATCVVGATLANTNNQHCYSHVVKAVRKATQQGPELPQRRLFVAVLIQCNSCVASRERKVGC